ncbi:hypothetical protein HKX48_009512 [Thoreauomyces humboldtii]|nr:hypothetical protein HKX48_009512 [Thoreauomyces humboldtii]
MSHQPKTTIHVTNITRDKATLKRMFQEMEGFRRISFHQDYCFVCFDDLGSATDAIDEIHSQTDMLAAYAKHGVASTTTPTIAVQPNPILYVSLFSYFTETELTRIFRTYEGFDSCRFFPSHALVRFKDMECSKRALEDLNSTTNLFANYSTKGAKQSGGRSRRGTVSSTSGAPTINGSVSQTATSIPGRGDRAGVESSSRRDEPGAVTGSGHPKRTIHVTNIDNDKASILALFSKYEGFRRVAFYADYCFVCFADTRTASKAVEELLFKTKMKANFAKADFIPHPIPSSAIGHPNFIIRVSDYPSNTTEYDLVHLMERYEGFQDVHFYHASCLVYYKDQACARRALEALNDTTNFTAIYSKKGISSRSRGGVSSGTRGVRSSAISVGVSGRPVATTASSTTTTISATIPPTGQSSSDSTVTTVEDESSSSPRGSPIPAMHRATASEDDEAESDEETDDQEEGSDEVPSQSSVPSRFIQPDSVDDDATLAVAAELADGDDVLDGTVPGDEEDDAIVGNFPVSVSDESKSTESDELEATDIFLHEHVAQHMQASPHEELLHHHQPGPQEIHKHMHFATFTQQHFHMSPQSHLSLSGLPAQGLAQSYAPSGKLPVHPYALAATNSDREQQEQHQQHQQQQSTPYDHNSLLLEKSGIENQLMAAKSFIDDMFQQYLHLEQENRLLRESHLHHSQQQQQQQHQQQRQIQNIPQHQQQDQGDFRPPLLGSTNPLSGDESYAHGRNVDHLRGFSDGRLTAGVAIPGTSGPLAHTVVTSVTNGSIHQPAGAGMVTGDVGMSLNISTGKYGTENASSNGSASLDMSPEELLHQQHQRLQQHLPAGSLPGGPSVIAWPQFAQHPQALFHQHQQHIQAQQQHLQQQQHQQQHQHQHQQSLYPEQQHASGGRPHTGDHAGPPALIVAVNSNSTPAPSQQQTASINSSAPSATTRNLNAGVAAQSAPVPVTPSSSASSSSATIATATDANPASTATAASVASAASERERSLTREIAQLREQLKRRNEEYERLDAAHKSCGVLQGLLAMCE